jgi:hypothetical protein
MASAILGRVSRATASVLMVLAGAVLSLVGGVVLYVQEEVVDRDSFSDRAVDSLNNRDVRDVVAHEVAAQLLGATGLGLDATAPELEATVNRAIRSPSFQRAFGRAAGETHDALFSRGDGSVFFDVPNVGRAIAPTLEAVAPGLADSIPREAETRLLEIERRHPSVRALRVADDLGPLGIGLIAIGVGLLAAGWTVAPDRRAALTRIALALGFGSALLVVALLVFKQVVAANAQGGFALAEDDVSPAVEGVWSAYAGDLVTSALVLAVLALGLAAGSAWTARRSGVGARHAL